MVEIVDSGSLPADRIVGFFERQVDLTLIAITREHVNALRQLYDKYTSPLSAFR